MDAQDRSMSLYADSTIVRVTLTFSRCAFP